MTQEEKESSDSLKLSFTQERTPKKYDDKLEERKPREFSPRSRPESSFNDRKPRDFAPRREGSFAPREGNFAPRSRPESNFNDRKPRDFAPRREGNRDSSSNRGFTPRPKTEAVSEERQAEDFFNS